MTRYAILAALAAALALCAGTALAVTKIATSTTITFINRDSGADPTDYFLGQISSPKHDCIVHRKVKLYRKKSGTDPLIGSDKSNNDGWWKVFKEDPKGMTFYYAKVKKREIETGAQSRVCKSARSGDLPVEPNRRMRPDWDRAPAIPPVPRR